MFSARFPVDGDKAKTQSGGVCVRCSFAPSRAGTRLLWSPWCRSRRDIPLIKKQRGWSLFKRPGSSQTPSVTHVSPLSVLALPAVCGGSQTFCPPAEGLHGPWRWLKQEMKLEGHHSFYRPALKETPGSLQPDRRSLTGPGPSLEGPDGGELTPALLGSQH